MSVAAAWDLPSRKVQSAGLCIHAHVLWLTMLILEVKKDIHFTTSHSNAGRGNGRGSLPPFLGRSSAVKKLEMTERNVTVSYVVLLYFQMNCLRHVKNNLLKTSKSLRQNTRENLDKEDKVRE